MILRLALNLIRVYAVLSAPVIPNASKDMLSLLNLNDPDMAWIGEDTASALQMLKPRHAFNVPEKPIFNKIMPETVAELCARYGADPEAE